MDNKKIRIYLFDKGFKLSDVAKVLNCTRQNLYYLISNNKINLSHINKLSEGLGLTHGELINIFYGVTPLKSKEAEETSKTVKNPKRLDKLQINI